MKAKDIDVQPRMDVRPLKSEGFVAIPYPPRLRTRVVEAMDSWKGFCALSDEEKRMLSGGDRLHDFGYMRRQDSGPHADDKELFHVVGRKIPALWEKAGEIKDKRATLFISAIDVLIQEAAPFIEAFARAVEKEYGLRGFHRVVADSKENWTFRYLHYFPGMKPSLANAHADRGGFTFHLWEDQVGGEYLDINDERWKPWPVSDAQTIIFPSMGLQYFSKNQLAALWHRVVPNDETMKKGRYAMVVFVDFLSKQRWNDKDFRIQDLEPGFNYTTPFNEFAKFFVEGQQGDK